MFERVRKVLAENLGVPEEEITLETRLFEDLGVDSMDLFNLIDVLEASFHVKIAEYSNANTVEDIVDMLNHLGK